MICRYAKRLSPRGVSVGILLCVTAGGCATGQQRTEIESVSDCRRLVAAPSAPLPSPASRPSEREATVFAVRPFRLLLDTKFDDLGLHQRGESQENPLELPLDVDDPRIRAYFAEIKRRIQAAWVYPREAVGRKQSGSGVIVFMIKRDGRVGEINIARSTGMDILDRYIENAIRLASPFPSIPCKITEEAVPLTVNFKYNLGT
jgi:TonB family protein